MEILGIELQTFLGFTVVAALITVTGNLIALYLKEFLAARSLDRWRAKQALIAVYERYRKPICAAAEELSGRCYRIAKDPQAWRATLGPEVIALVTSNGVNYEDDAHYRRYKLLSDAYRLCCLFGWFELYRRDLGLLDTGAEAKNRQLDELIRSVRSNLADGQKNGYPDWDAWRDTLIFREEQRAIGHRMIVPSPGSGLIDFGTFCEQVERAEGPARWFAPAITFFAHIHRDRDFRRFRCRLLVVDLNALRELLQPGSIWHEHVKGTEALKEEIAAERSKMTAKHTL